jgi:hypothetical protein
MSPNQSLYIDRIRGHKERERERHGERDQLGLGRLGHHLKCRSCQDRVFRSLVGGCGGNCVVDTGGRLRAASFRDSREACYSHPPAALSEVCFEIGVSGRCKGTDISCVPPSAIGPGGRRRHHRYPPVSFGLEGRGECEQCLVKDNAAQPLADTSSALAALARTVLIDRLLVLEQRAAHAVAAFAEHLGWRERQRPTRRSAS